MQCSIVQRSDPILRHKAETAEEEIVVNTKVQARTTDAQPDEFDTFDDKHLAGAAAAPPRFALHDMPPLEATEANIPKVSSHVWIKTIILFFISFSFSRI